MNFNNPDDVYSSSPLSGDNSSPIAGDNTTALSDEDEDIGKIDSSLDSNETSESSSRLDAALRQATTHAGTQQLHLDPSGGGNDGDVSMDIAEDEITTSFKPSATKGDLAIEGHQVNKDPFAGILPSTAHEESDGEDMSMDITRAIGSIVQQAESQSSDVEDMSMDLTVPLGSIKSTNTQEQTSRRKSLKRRASLFEASQGSPAKRSASRRTSIRQRTAATDESSAQDATMDFTVAIGTIKNASMAKKQRSPLRRNSVDTSFGEETMDFTVAIGGIKNAQTSAGQQANVNSSDDEDMSMEFTKVVGGIKNLSKQATTPPKPRTDHTDNLTDIKVASPKRSPRRSRLSEAKGTQASLSPQKSHSLTPKTTPDRTPRSSTGTPVIPPPSEQIEMFEPSPFVRRAPATLAPHSESLATPTRASPQIPQSNIPYDPIAAPILNRRRSSLSSVQFSPLCPAKEEPILKSSALLSNIRLLSTPRKQTLMSPSKRGLTPKNLQTHLTAATPRRQTPTPRRLMSRESVSPMKRVAFGNESASENAENKDEVRTQAEEDPQDDEVDRISLQEFLDMTKIRFMDLSTTKRRHTAAPSSFHDKEVEEKEESLDRYVVAAACTLPEYELYQHACHEMKKYISDGRHFVRTMEANVLEENPVLFTEYLTAPPDQRIVMDNQFKNLKTSARLDARGEWYGWRSTLLHDLRSGLLSTMEGFLRDESVLKEQEEQLDAILPQLIQRHEQLGAQCQQLQQRHDELNSCDREELEQIRERLVAADSGLAEKRQLLAQLKEELSSKEARLEAVKERKIECAAEIKAAERVREECRGWSTKEVTDLKGMLICMKIIFLC
jgi:kinetochore protein Spc7/SPC105